MERSSFAIALGLLFLLGVAWIGAHTHVALIMSLVLLPVVYVLLCDKYPRLTIPWFQRMRDKILPKNLKRRGSLGAASIFWILAANYYFRPMTKPSSTGRSQYLFDPMWNTFGNAGVIVMLVMIGAVIVWWGWRREQ